MSDSAFPIIAVAALVAVVASAALFLTLRDHFARAHGKTNAQIRARFSAWLQLRRTLYLCAPGILIMTFGIFFAIDRGRDHDSDWWHGLLFIPVGWFLVPLLARRSWKRYLDLRQFADRDADLAFDQHSQSVEFDSQPRTDQPFGR
ncbi:MAG TPA: hypothetical protein VKR59_04355 [Terriglobales bacterium]|nr:hypothetical protein [Terriglobales bacterium]